MTRAGLLSWLAETAVAQQGAAANARAEAQSAAESNDLARSAELNGMACAFETVAGVLAAMVEREAQS